MTWEWSVILVLSALNVLYAIELKVSQRRYRKLVLEIIDRVGDLKLEYQNLMTFMRYRVENIEKKLEIDVQEVAARMCSERRRGK